MARPAPSGRPLRNLLDRLFPAQLYQPTRPKEFAQIAADLARASTPVAFNAYAAGSRRELVFCNQATFGCLGLSPDHVRTNDPRRGRAGSRPGRPNRIGLRGNAPAQLRRRWHVSFREGSEDGRAVAARNDPHQ